MIQVMFSLTPAAISFYFVAAESPPLSMIVIDVRAVKS